MPSQGCQFNAEIIEHNFIVTAVDWLAPHPLLAATSMSFDCAILNPPYRKLNSQSDARRLLREAGIETSNLYTAFLWLVLKLLGKTGEFIAITPRSFCNGPYFRPFRKALLSEANISRVHVFESRKTAFREDDVLQENIIFAPQGYRSTGRRSFLHLAGQMIQTWHPERSSRRTWFQSVTPARSSTLLPMNCKGRWRDVSGAFLRHLPTFTSRYQQEGLWISEPRMP